MIVAGEEEAEDACPPEPEADPEFPPEPLTKGSPEEDPPPPLETHPVSGHVPAPAAPEDPPLLLLPPVLPVLPEGTGVPVGLLSADPPDVIADSAFEESVSDLPEIVTPESAESVDVSLYILMFFSFS